MKASIFKFSVVMLAVAALVGCAERYRDADSGRTAAEVEDLLRKDLANAQAAQGGTGRASAQAMVEDPATSVYFAESFVATPASKPAMGPVEVVTPLDFPSLQIDVGLQDIKSIRVYFLDQIKNGRHNHAIVFYIESGSNGTPSLYVWANDENNGEVESYVDDEGIFQVTFNMGSQTLIIESDDTLDGELANVIQLQLLIDDGQSEPYSIGQISSMIGYLSEQ